MKLIQPTKQTFDAKQKRQLNSVLEDAPSKLNHFLRAYEGGTYKDCVVAKCLECVSCDVQAIRECTSTSCPLYAKRPYQEVRS